MTLPRALPLPLPVSHVMTIKVMVRTSILGMGPSLFFLFFWATSRSTQGLLMALSSVRVGGPYGMPKIEPGSIPGHQHARQEPYCLLYYHSGPIEPSANIHSYVDYQPGKAGPFHCWLLAQMDAKVGDSCILLGLLESLRVSLDPTHLCLTASLSSTCHNIVSSQFCSYAPVFILSCGSVRLVERGECWAPINSLAHCSRFFITVF